MTHPTTQPNPTAAAPIVTVSPARFARLAWTSLILGILGVAFAVVPILDIMTMLGAVVGGVLGVVALFGSRKVLAGIGVAVCLLAVILTAAAMSSFSSAVSKTSPPTLGGSPAVPAAPAAPAPSGPVTSFGDGTYVVGTDVVPGTYKTTGPASGLPCYWARLKDTSGEFGAIIANGNPTGPTTVTIKKGDGAFHTFGCNTWQKVG